MRPPEASTLPWPGTPKRSPIKDDAWEFLTRLLPNYVFDNAGPATCYPRKGIIQNACSPENEDYYLQWIQPRLSTVKLRQQPPED